MTQLQHRTVPSDTALGSMPRLQPDIQLLRAIAVLSVVVFHLSASALPGGYVGVDVFFVISGYLITGHLVRQATTTGRIDLAAFWARRIRRLLPAALLVLAVTALLIWRLAPPTSWAQFFTETVASATSWENWFLAASSVDYLAEGSAASPVQHFWSLSVEEQFYLALPLVVVVCTAATRRAGRLELRQVLTLALSVIGIASLVTSIAVTSSAPAPAYFVTPTRAWEFAAGGLLALIGPAVLVHRDRWRTGAGFLGLVLLATSVLMYTGDTPFPGIAAVVPVVGTLLVIAGGSSTHRWSVTTIARGRLSNFFGDTSYSLYLWRWPVIVFAPMLLGRPPGWPESIAVLALSIVLAATTRHFIEDPVRRAPKLAGARPRRTFTVAAGATAIVLCIPLIGLASVRVQEQDLTATVDAYVQSQEPCFGAAAALTRECSNPRLADELLPPLAVRTEDTGDTFRCSAAADATDFPGCSFGSERADAVRVAITGNSHATMLIPGLTDQLQERNWRLDVYVGKGCEWREPAVDDSEACSARRTILQRAFTGGRAYDIVLVTSKSPDETSVAEQAAIRTATLAAWRPVLERGTSIVVLRDNPRVPVTAAACVDRTSAAELLDGACAFPVTAAYPTFDLNTAAAAMTDGAVPVIDLGELYCPAGTCSPAVGHVLVYRDLHHITATWSRTLAPILVEAIEQATARP
ncbi:MAG TPA: acyltransferase family protein [Plantibacter sp.]|uniref:acyltransferase family protein n=1 Tax=Plantibacter sp. TaxID=1871045 RepID=UPI002C009E46|nr:acyltransferase family protein [Plantibacter sp.]